MGIKSTRGAILCSLQERPAPRRAPDGVMRFPGGVEAPWAPPAVCSTRPTRSPDATSSTRRGASPKARPRPPYWPMTRRPASTARVDPLGYRQPLGRLDQRRVDARELPPGFATIAREVADLLPEPLDRLQRVDHALAGGFPGGRRCPVERPAAAPLHQPIRSCHVSPLPPVSAPDCAIAARKTGCSGLLCRNQTCRAAVAAGRRIASSPACRSAMQSFRHLAHTKNASHPLSSTTSSLPQRPHAFTTPPRSAPSRPGRSPSPRVRG